MNSLIVRSQRVVLADGVRPATILVEDGRIVRIAPHDYGIAAAPELDAGELTILPGLVDTHVHVNEPGRTHWEGFESATRAAAAGGVTTLVDMPLNSVPATTSVGGLHAKRVAARGKCYVDVAFWGGLVPGNTEELEPLAHAGVRGFKCFLSPSGVEEFEHVTEKDLQIAAPILFRLGLPLLVHAELPELLLDPDADDPRAYRAWLRSRPAAAEHAAIERLIHIARQYGARIHIVHLASQEPLPLIRSARAEGVAITVETCPHYLTFAAEEIPDGNTAFKCAPPIREAQHREALWRGLVEGDIDLIATDHSPAPPSLKSVDEGDFIRAWGGIASLQIGLVAVWSNARLRGIGIERVVGWMSEAPARLAGLDDVKGSIAVGKDADLVIFDPEPGTVVDPSTLHHRHPVTPYAGIPVRGAVRTTMLRGEIVFHDGEVMPNMLGKMIGSRP